MGTNYYKISPQIKEFIVKKAQEHSELGCRKISSLILEELKLTISKSSIAAILKTEGLSRPIGRRKPPTLINQEPSLPPLAVKEALAVKFILEDDSFFFLDADCHSIWSTAHIPQFFGSGLDKTRDLLYAMAQEEMPLILQAAPGFGAPTSAFISFIASFQSEKPEKAIKRIELYSGDSQLIDTIQPLPQKKRYFIVGLWPWQYKEARDGLALRFIGYKKDGREVLALMTNLEEGQRNNDEIIGRYLQRWPNLESGYQDFLDKIGHLYQRAALR